MTGKSSIAGRRDSGGAGWLLGLIFVCLATGIVAAGYFYYRNYEKHYRSEVERQLSAVADLKVGELAQWRRERLADGAVFFKNGSFSGFVRRFFEKPEDAQAQRQIQAWVEKYQTVNQYDHVRLLDAQGVTRMSVPAGRSEMSSTVAQRLPEVLRTGQVTFQDFYQNEHDQRVYLAVLVPIVDEQEAGRPLGVLVLRIDPETYLYPFIQRWPTPSLTAETLLVRREGNEVVFLNELRFQKNTALTLRRPLDQEALPGARAVSGQEGIMEGIDYRGVPVVAALRAIPDSPWSLVAHMDAAEVYAPLRERLWQMVFLIGAVLFGAGAGIALLWRQQRVRFYREGAETENKTRRLVTVVRDSNDAITIQDFEGRITAWNHGAELMYGYSEEEALLANIERLTAPGKVAEQKDFNRRLFAGEKVTSLETQRVTQDGRILDIWMTVTKLVDDTGKPIGIASTERDITARKREEKNLRRMATVVRDSNDAITIQDFEGRITAWNRGAELMYGYSEKEALQMSIGRLTAPGKVEEQNDFTRRLLTGEKISSFETQRVTKDGRILDIWMTVTKLVDDTGKPIGIASTERDITARKRAVEEVQKLNAELEQRVVERTAQLEASNKELEAFSYSVSHDLRAPLRAMDGFSMALLEDCAGRLDETAQDHLRRIRAGSQRMAELIDDLLSLSQVTRTEMRRERMDLTAMAEEIGAEFQRAHPDRQVKSVVAPALTADADARMLRIVLNNLLDNAWKFTGRCAQARIEVGAREQDGQRVFFVRDNGAGFDMAYGGRLFGAFQRLHSTQEFEGTGIGLAIVQRIIHRHGGRVWAEGAVGQGATVYFTLGKERD
jgi:PAS domain S-box-containing protein